MRMPMLLTFIFFCLGYRALAAFFSGSSFVTEHLPAEQALTSWVSLTADVRVPLLVLGSCFGLSWVVTALARASWPFVRLTFIRMTGYPENVERLAALPALPRRGDIQHLPYVLKCPLGGATHGQGLVLLSYALIRMEQTDAEPYFTALYRRIDELIRLQVRIEVPSGETDPAYIRVAEGADRAQAEAILEQVARNVWLADVEGSRQLEQVKERLGLS
jgi:hypothetical protein